MSKGNNQNPFKVLPSYHFWVGHKTRSSNEVLNTEFEKIKTAKVSEESQVYHVIEDRLMEELMNQKVYLFCIMYFNYMFLFSFTCICLGAHQNVFS